ncbi:hypothetical protein [uncultured Bifidobacterium sp.]|uniref:hypothetical protein n=1 Tax=uncultured Bifidobacterium sp. TaxID=165187 RepID=UPI0026042CBE|nr:hypothetical protein [uncultured Bifidobacterium sp.]
MLEVLFIIDISSNKQPKGTIHWEAQPNNARKFNACEFVKAQAEAQHIEKAISFNVKVMLAANGIDQATPSERLELKHSTMSIKLASSSSWYVPNLVETAYSLNTTPLGIDGRHTHDPHGEDAQRRREAV